MSYDWDALDDSLFGPVQQEPTSTAVEITGQPQEKPYAQDRGLLGDIGSGIARTGLSLLEMGSHAGEFLGSQVTGRDIDLPFDDWAERQRREKDIFKPDKAEYQNESIWAGLAPGALTESVTTSLGAAAPGAIAGGTAGSVFGPLGTTIGAAGGGVLSALFGWGGSAAQERKEELIAKGWSEEEAEDAAWRAFAIEGGTEAAAAGLDILTAGTGAVATQVVKQGAKATAKNMLKMTGKDLVKKTAAIVGTENVTEQIQLWLGRQEEMRVGLANKNVSLEEMLETSIATTATSLFFAAGASGYSAKQKSTLKKALESDSKVARDKASRVIYTELQKDDPESAALWKTYTDSLSKNNLPIKLDDDFVELGNKIEGSNVDRADITSTNPDIQKHAADQILEQAGINSDGSLNSETVNEKIEAAKFVTEAEEAVKQKSTDAKLKVREAQLEQQKLEQSRAEKQLSEVQGTTDPLITLENQMKQVEEQGFYPEEKKAIAEDIVAKKTEEPKASTAEESAKVFEEAGPTKLEERVEDVQVLQEADQVQEEVQDFVDKAKLYVQDSNQRRTLGMAFQELSQEAKAKLQKFVDINTLMQEVDPESNQVIQEQESVAKVIPQIEQELTQEQQEVIQDLPEEEVIQARETAQEDKGVGDTVAATTMTPEMELERKETLEKAGLTEDDLAPTTDPEALHSAAKSPEAKAFVDGNIEELQKIFQEGNYRKDQVPAFTEKILRELGPDVVSKNEEQVKGLMAQLRTSLSTPKVNQVSGSKMTDAIQWEPGKGNTQQGTHKETGEIVAIGPGEKLGTYDIYVGKSLVDTVKGKVAARQAAEKYVTPLSKEFQEGLSKRGTYGKAVIEGATVSEETVKGESKVDKAKEKDTTEEASEVRKITGDELEELKKQYGGKVFQREAIAEKHESLEPASVKDRRGNLENIRDARTLLEHSLANQPVSDQWIAPLTRAILRRAGDKLANIPVHESPTGESFYRDGRIFLGNKSAAVRLHEAVHAITVEEMRNDSKLKADVEDLFFKVRKELLTEEQLNELAQMRTSNEFKNQWKSKENLKGENVDILYGLLNKEEFLAQAFNSPQFREALNNLELKNRRGRVQKAWSMLKDFIKQAMRRAGINNDLLKEGSALEKVFQLIDDLQGVEVDTSEVQSGSSFSALTPEELDASIDKHINTKDKDLGRLEKIGNYWKSFEKQVSETFQSTYEAIKTIDLDIAEKVRRTEERINKKGKKRTDKAKEFTDRYNKLDKKDKLLFNLYISNPSSMYQERLQKMMGPRMKEEFQVVKGVLEEVNQEAKELGLLPFDTHENYFPRFVKDLDGLVSYLRQQDQWTQFEEGIAQAEEKKGSTLSDTEKAEVITSMIVTGRNPQAIAKNPSALKKRAVDTVSAGMIKYYADAPVALGKYINEMTEKIEISRMLGNTKRAEKMRQLNSLNKKLDKATTDKARDTLVSKIETIEAELPSMEEAVEQGLGNLIQEKSLNPEDSARVKELVRSRVNQVGTGKLVSNIRSAALLGSLTQFTTGIRQFSDNVWSMYQNGILPTLQAAAQVATGSSDVKDNPFDYQGAIKEFNDSPAFIDKALQMSGIHLMDKTMKKVNLQATINNAKKVDPKKFKDKWEPIFGEETDQVFKDLKAGNMTDNVEYLLFSTLANYQPVSLSEMPPRYLRGGNGRIFYLLKSYATKSSNNFYRESIQEMRKGNIKKGVKNLLHLGILFTLMNASTDWLIDWLNGKEPDFEDSMVDSLLTLSFTSRYALDKSEREGLVKNMLGNMIVPTNIMDLPYKDLLNLFSGEDRKPTLNSLKLVPGFGQILYNQADPEGQKKILKNTRKLLIERMESGEIDRKSINEFNKEARKTDGIGTLDAKTIREAKKKSRENANIGDVLSIFSPKEAGAAELPISSLVSKHANRLGVDQNTAMNNLLEFSELVGKIESDGNLKAQNNTTTAEGLFQFVDGSIEPAINRLTKYIPEEDWMTQVIKDKEVSKLNKEQQTLLFLGDMLEKKGSDKFMKKVMESGDKKAMLQAYYKLHHTSPDAATKKRATRIMYENS